MQTDKISNTQTAPSKDECCEKLLAWLEKYGYYKDKKRIPFLSSYGVAYCSGYKLLTSEQLEEFCAEMQRVNAMFENPLETDELDIIIDAISKQTWHSISTKRIIRKLDMTVEEVKCFLSYGGTREIAYYPTTKWLLSQARDYNE